MAHTPPPSTHTHHGHKKGGVDSNPNLHCLDHSLFRVRIIVIIALLHKGSDPVGADIPMFVNVNIFLQFPIMQPARLHRHRPVLRGMANRTQNLVLFVGACGLLRTGCASFFCFARGPVTSDTPSLRHQSALFSELMVFVVHLGTQQHVACMYVFMQTW